jgi:hypothetical protein
MEAFCPGCIVTGEARLTTPLDVYSLSIVTGSEPSLAIIAVPSSRTATRLSLTPANFSAFPASWEPAACTKYSLGSWADNAMATMMAVAARATIEAAPCDIPSIFRLIS